MKIFLFVLIAVGLGYGGWLLERDFKYKYAYQSRVKNEIKPLEERIDALELRVKQLER